MRCCSIDCNLLNTSAAPSACSLRGASISSNSSGVITPLDSRSLADISFKIFSPTSPPPKVSAVKPIFANSFLGLTPSLKSKRFPSILFCAC